MPVGTSTIAGTHHSRTREPLSYQSIGTLSVQCGYRGPRASSSRGWYLAVCMHFSASRHCTQPAPGSFLPARWCGFVAFQQGGAIQDASDHARSLVAFEEMLDFLVVRLVSTASGVVPVKCVPRMEKRKMFMVVALVSDVLFSTKGVLPFLCANGLTLLPSYLPGPPLAQTS